MGNSDSRPSFNYEAQLFADTAKSQSIEVDDPAGQADNASRPRRLAGLEKGLVSVPYAQEDGGCTTVYSCFQRGVRLFPGNRCFGTRVWVTEEQKDAADAPRYKLEDKAPMRGDYVWETYAEIDEAARDVGAGLVAMGYPHHTNVGIFSANRVEWMVGALGLYSQNMRVVSLYPSLGENAVEFIINHAEVPVVLVSKQNMPALLKSLPNMQNVKHIIQWDVDAKYNNVLEVVAAADIETCKAAGIELLGFSAVKARGAAAREAIQPNPAKPDDLAYIMYTSGTTGNPKGAMLLHSNIVSSIAAVPFIVTLTDKDSYLSYLPLCHIYETVIMTAILVVGGRVGFFQDNIRKLTVDLCSIQPTLLCGVPRVFSRIYQVVMNGVAEKSCIVRWYFNRALNAQCDHLRAGEPLDQKYDQKVFAPLRQRMGLEKVRVIVSGAAPTAPYLSEFLRVVSAVPVLEGYGMTEACAATSIGTMGDRNLGQTGPPLSCCEVRLEDIPDMHYLHTDKNPRGEICVRGPNVFAGYWRDPENTAATVVDGWLHTGDVGRFNPNGTISIIDRKKNLFKLSQGEYIAVESVESAYAKAATVGQVWVYGNGYKSFLLGVLVPAAEPTASYAFSKGWWPRAEVESTKLVADTFPVDFKALWEGAHRDELKAWVMEALRAQDKQLKGFERVADFIIEANIDKLGMAFTEANECLTPTFKLRRPQLLQRYIAPLKKLYGVHKEPVQPDEKWPGEQ